MQKIALSKIIREEILRAIVFGTTLFVIMVGTFSSIAYAADGGIFGDILNRILASSDWKNPGDGTVKNAQRLNNIEASGYVRVTPGQSCPTGQCIGGINPDGSVICQP